MCVVLGEASNCVRQGSLRRSEPPDSVRSPHRHLQLGVEAAELRAPAATIPGAVQSMESDEIEPYIPRGMLVSLSAQPEE